MAVVHPYCFNNVATYLVRGIYSNEEVKNSVKELDLSSVGINDLSTYKGIPISKSHAEKDMFKINLLNMLEK